MMRILLTYFFLSLIVLGLARCKSPVVVNCDDQFLLNSEDPIEFSNNEKQLLCGNENLDGWENVPLVQTEMTIKGLLQNRGYFDTEFSVSEDQKLIVTTGSKTRIKDLVFINAPEEFYKAQYYGWKETGYTSENLDKIEGWVLRRLRAIGYGCASISTMAIIDTGIVEVHIEPGSKQFFPQIDLDTDPKKRINKDVLERFYAFSTGDIFNADLLALSTRRIEEEGVVSRSNFFTTCEEDMLHIEQTVNPGTSHLLRIGAGISTEEFPIFKASWKSSRIGEEASILFADLYASHRRQSVSTGYEWHVFDANRWFLIPTLEARRISDVDQKYYEMAAYTPIGAGLDHGSVRIDFKFGPSASIENAQEGPTTGHKQFMQFRSQVELTSNDFEVFSTDPKEGYRLALDTSSVLVSSVEQVWANKISLVGTKLWNLGSWGPPRFVLGLRFGLDSVFAKGDDVRENLPQSYFTWLGGDNSVRGFSRRELPQSNGEIGSLSSFYIGGEFRMANYFGEGWDPFVFADAGLLGEENFQWDSALYWSPGLGLRYQSFIGVIRATVSRGFVVGQDGSDIEHFQFFLSLGREF